MVRHTAVHWVDRVFPRVPVRQWVLTFPWPLRLRLARNHYALKALHAHLQPHRPAPVPQAGARSWASAMRAPAR